MIEILITMSVLLAVLGVLAMTFIFNRKSPRKTAAPWWSAPQAGLGGL
jgi:hypothetical protein